MVFLPSVVLFQRGLRFLLAFVPESLAPHVEWIIEGAANSLCVSK
jgi:hypothetical protein